MRRPAVALSIVVFYFAILNARPDFTRFNAHDSESYLALAHSLVNGRGYTRSMIEGMYIPHNIWPPGVPALMSPAIVLGGETVNWHLVKATMAVVGLLGVAAAWLLVYRVTGRAAFADAGALLLALNPGYWDFSHQAMAEVPTVVWVLGSLLLADAVFAGKTPRGSTSLLVGLACGAGMLIKGNVFGLALTPLAHLVGPRAMRGTPRAKAIVALLFMIGFVVPFGAWTLRNRAVPATGFDGVSQIRMILQKDVLDPEMKSWGEIAAQSYGNLRTYGVYRLPELTIPGLWAEGALAWPGSGWVAIGLTFLMALLVFPWNWRAQYFGLDLVILPMVLLYLPYSVGGAARYWVAAAALYLVLAAIRATHLKPLPRSAARLLMSVGAAALVVNIAAYVVHHERHPYDRTQPWQQLAELFAAVSREPIETRGVLTPNMHAFQLMTGHPAPMAHAQYDPTYDHMVARVTGVGLQPPPGSIPKVVVFPWALYQLPEPRTRTELLGDRDYSVGLALGRIF